MEYFIAEHARIWLFVGKGPESTQKILRTLDLMKKKWLSLKTCARFVSENLC